MKKILLAVVALAGLSALALEARAEAVVPGRQSYEMKKDQSDMKDLFMKWALGLKAAWNLNSSCQLVTTGQGKLASLSAYGQPSDFVAIFDASAIGSLSAATPDTTKLIIKASIDTVKVSGHYDFANPKTFTAGLVLCPSGAQSTGQIEYHQLRK